MKCDVVVVGAGPAGAVAAHHLAKAGIRVVLLDKATFPRDKSCGDGISGESLVILERIGLKEWIKQFQEMEILRLISPNGNFIDLSKELAEKSQTNFRAGRTIPRRLLDEELLSSAMKVGTKVMEGIKAETVLINQNHAEVVYARGKITANIVILAEGSHAHLTHSLGLSQKISAELVAVRQYMEGDIGPENRIEMHFQKWILPQYAWLFPIGNGQINIGVGASTNKAHAKKVNLIKVLEKFKKDTLLDNRLVNAKPISPIKGHPLRTCLDKTQTHNNNLMVIGDAAGLVNPFTGEGIHPAMYSGELAAKHALSALERGDFSRRGLMSYSNALNNRFLPDLKASRFLRQILNYPMLFNRLINNLQNDEDLGVLICLILVGNTSPRLALRPTTLKRMFI